MSTTPRTSAHLPTTIVFTDLDGTLLDYDGYTWDAAADAVHALLVRGAAIVFCSSKTRAEQEFYQAELDVHDPMIVENGSAIVVQRGYFPGVLATVEAGRLRAGDDHEEIVLGYPRALVDERLREIRQARGLDVRGYCDMTIEEICQRTGLSEAQARRAREREFSETVEVGGGPDAWLTFLEALEEWDLRGFGNGPTGTVVGSWADKGRAVRLLSGLYRRAATRLGAGYGLPPTVGIGDAASDASMLAEVDHAFLVERAGGGWAGVVVDGLERVEGVGPEGWARAVERILREGVVT